ncbi:hypothetical protein FJTKL_07393 [Diaporthe vaccinii]|uniref:Clr5 domain-containing protein n=1 Tax=Diaporthe vaccinii TaxID=105482 RepID=A0ABR4ETY6_9PEZI
MSAPKDLSLWNSKKEVLYDLFIRRNNKLKDVKTIMERDHEFPNSLKLSEYECVLRVFKFRKYLKADDWRLSVGPKIAKRQAKGKHSEVLLNGSKVQNIDRKIRRAHTGKRSHYQTGQSTASNQMDLAYFQMLTMLRAQCGTPSWSSHQNHIAATFNSCASRSAVPLWPRTTVE